MIDSMIVCALLMLMDIVCGVTSAAKNRVLASGIMREGLFNKFSELLLLATALMCHEILTIDPFDNMGIPPEVMYSVCIYIGSMELLSIVENICKINPNLPLSKILLMFNIDVDEDEQEMVESEKALGE